MFNVHEHKPISIKKIGNMQTKNLNDTHYFHLKTIYLYLHVVLSFLPKLVLAFLVKMVVPVKMMSTPMTVLVRLSLLAPIVNVSIITMNGSRGKDYTFLPLGQAQYLKMLIL